MNFNTLAQSINENISTNSITNEEMEGKRGRTANPEIEKLVAQGLPYWKARAMVRKGMSGGEAPVAGTTTEPATPSPSRGNAKTQAAIDDFIAGNPDATTEDVIEHLKALNAGPLSIKVGYNTDPADVAQMLAIAKGEDVPVSAEEPGSTDIGSAEDPEVDRLANLFMKLYTMPKDQRAEYMRKVKTAKTQKDVEDKFDDEEENDDDVDPYVSQYVKSMKDEPEESEEEFDEPKED